MESTVIPQIDYEIFNTQSESWWSDNGIGSLTQVFLQPMACSLLSTYIYAKVGELPWQSVCWTWAAVVAY